MDDFRLIADNHGVQTLDGAQQFHDWSLVSVDEMAAGAHLDRRGRDGARRPKLDVDTTLVTSSRLFDWLQAHLFHPTGHDRRWIDTVVKPTSSLEDLRRDDRAALTSRVWAYLDLPAGWAGPEALPVPTAAVAEALAFVDLIPLGSESPQPYASGDGEVGFVWRSDRGFIDVSFYGDGLIHFYGDVFDETGEISGSPTFDQHVLPASLSKAISLL